MNSPSRETWTFRVMLPAGVEHGDRLVARVLKHLLRTWGIRCTAILEAPPADDHAGAERRTDR